MPAEIRVPRLGWSMEEGTFVDWLKQDGDRVAVGEPLFELEGEKALQPIESLDAGILRIPPDAPKPGSVVPVGAVLGYVLADGEASPWDSQTSQPPKTSVPPAVPTEQPPAAPSVRRKARELGVALHQVAGTGSGGKIVSADVERAARPAVEIRMTSPAMSPMTSSPKASPRARRVAVELGVDWTRLSGTGRGGRIREQDVRAAIVTSAIVGAARSIPITPRRRAIAERMLASTRDTAPVTLTTRADATHLVSLRNQFKAAGAATVPALTDIVAKLVAHVLRDHPLLAGRWAEDRIELPGETGYHIGIAVDTDDGLLVPVVRDVLNRPLLEIAVESRQLIDRARAGRLTLAEMTGGVFTITNLGTFGIDAFTPVINLPETSVLGLGAIRKEPAVLPDGSVGIRELITLSLTFDHRVIDGAPAARFLQALVQALENASASLLMTS